MRMLVLGDDGKYTLDRPFDRWRDPELRDQRIAGAPRHHWTAGAPHGITGQPEPTGSLDRVGEP